MSEYQYYEFLAVDRPLDRATQHALRSISSRARISATGFVNHYEWGDLKGDPRKLVAQWFDLHLYFANWGSRRLMMRVPKRFLDPTALDPFLREVDWVDVEASGNDVIIDIHRDEEGADTEWDEGSGWLATLAPLRSDVLSGDLRLFYLLWLMAVQDDLVSPDEVEPLAGIGPLSGAHESFAAFFDLDPDLVQAAAERSIDRAALSDKDRLAVLAAIPEQEKTELLSRVFEGDAHVAAELRRKLRANYPVPVPERTAGALQMRAREIAQARAHAEAKRQEAERRRQAREAEKAQRARLEVLKQRGDKVWHEIEEEIERRNAPGYDRAASLLSDLQALAKEDGSLDDFGRRLASIRLRHERKAKFIERLSRL